jgi:hypothetical protein
MWWRGSFLWSWIAVLGLQPIAPKVHCSYWDAARIHVISVGHKVPKHVLYIYNTTLQRRSGLLLPSSYAVGYQYIIREHGYIYMYHVCQYRRDCVFFKILMTICIMVLYWCQHLLSVWFIDFRCDVVAVIKYVHVIGTSHIVSMHTYTILAQVTIQCPSIRDFSVGHTVPQFITSENICYLSLWV